MTNILIVLYNSLSYVVRLMASIEASTKVDYRVFVWDNGSDDNAIDYFKGYKKKNNLWYHHSEENLGYSRGVNKLLDVVSQEQGDIVLINPDCWVDDEWLLKMKMVKEKIPDVGIISPRIMSGNKDYAVWSRTSLTWPTLTKIGDYVEMAWASFACVYITRTCLNQVGKLDESLWHYGSDEDFGRRARSIGWKIIYTPYSTVHHVGQRSFVELIKRDRKLAENKVGKHHVETQMKFEQIIK